MAKRVFLALAIHNHQPVGNFDSVFEEGYCTSYLPMIDLLERHTGVRLALHYTGPLRDWIVDHKPELFRRIRALVARGQVEIMTGGYDEPVLVAIPDADKLGQVRKLTEAVKADFGYDAVGAWLAERVWEPHLPKPLAEAGVQYTVVDDTHFKYVGLEDSDLLGYYVTEEQGTILRIFGTSKHLRYTIPWASVDEVVGWLREQASEDGAPVAVMGDDGEKFGMWPGTYEHCWEKGWMERFFTALEANSDWLHTITLADYIRQFPAIGRVYLPTASYDEMTEWALPAPLAGDIVDLKHRLQDEGREDVLRFIRGGFWRSFMVKYPEINTMHKKMLRVSGKAHAIADPETRERALTHLWHGQCNCPYWHGVFGGIYLSHIRTANYHHLLEAENLADSAARPTGSWVEVEHTDLDRDSRPELLVSTPAMNLYFAPHVGGSLFEWDWREMRFNLTNTLSRRPEGYHRLLTRAAEQEEGEGGEVKTIHDIVRVKEPGLEKRLFYDWYRRVSLIDHLFHPGATLQSFYEARYGEAGDFVLGEYEVEEHAEAGRAEIVLRRDGGVWILETLAPVRVEKRVSVSGDEASLPVHYRLTNTGDAPISTTFGVEFNFGLLSGHTHDAYYRIRGVPPEASHLDSMGETADTERVALVHEWFKLHILLEMTKPCHLWRLPVETISNSEGGFERIYQASCIVPRWQVHLEPGQSWEVGLHFRLSPLPEEVA